MFDPSFSDYYHMRLAQVDYKAIQTPPPLNRFSSSPETAKRKDLQLYQDFPEMLTYFLLVEESLSQRGYWGRVLFV